MTFGLSSYLLNTAHLEMTATAAPLLDEPQHGNAEVTVEKPGAGPDGLPYPVADAAPYPTQPSHYSGTGPDGLPYPVAGATPYPTQPSHVSGLAPAGGDPIPG